MKCTSIQLFYICLKHIYTALFYIFTKNIRSAKKQLLETNILTMNIKLGNKTKIKVEGSVDIFLVMQQILLREQKVDRGREHFWTVSLDNAQKILSIELVSMGSFNKTVVVPMEVLSIPLQKRAVKLILVHNHPSGNVLPSEADKDITDRLIQAALIVDTPIVDHLIISENTYYSFADNGILAELENSIKYVPAYKLKERFEKQGLEKGIEKGIKQGLEKGIVTGIEKGIKKEKKEMATTMKKRGFAIKMISEFTGLSVSVIEKIKVD